MDSSLERKKYKWGQHPNSRKKLQMFAKGSNGDHSHNGYTLTSTIKDLLHQASEFIPPNALGKDKLWREQIARAVLVKAAQGDVGMVKELLERVDGKVKESPAVKVNVDNRVLNIYVKDAETKDLIGKVKDRTEIGNATE